MFMVLSREFLKNYASIIDPIPGFLEYRLPTLAKQLGYSFIKDPLLLESDEYILYGEKAVSQEMIEAEANKVNSARIFHPVYATHQARLPHPIYS